MEVSGQLPTSPSLVRVKVWLDLGLGEGWVSRCPQTFINVNVLQDKSAKLSFLLKYLSQYISGIATITHAFKKAKDCRPLHFSKK